MIIEHKAIPNLSLAIDNNDDISFFTSALRIHVSNDTYEILQRLGGYKLDYRGEMEVKGRGMMKTWWLAGKQGYTKELPIPDPLDE